MAQVILITGASSGLGKSTAQYLSGLGHVVYGTSRKPASTDTGFHLLEMDVTDQHSVSTAVQKVIAAEGKIDVLINNAGMGIGGALENFSDAETRKQFDTNYFGLTNVVRAVLPHMRSRKSGKIINVSSIGGLMGLPYQGHYSGAKFAVEGYSEALYLEVKPFNIKVVLVEPGDFRTGFTSSRILTEKDIAGTDYDQYLQRALRVIEKDEQGGSDPAILARTMGRIVSTARPKFRYVVGRFDQRMIAALKPILPHRLLAWILADHYKAC